MVNCRYNLAVDLVRGGGDPEVVERCKDMGFCLLELRKGEGWKLEDVGRLFGYTTEGARKLEVKSIEHFLEAFTKEVAVEILRVNNRRNEYGSQFDRNEI